MAPDGTPIDTDVEIADLLAARWRDATVTERVDCVRAMQVDVDRMAVAGIRQQHPGIDDDHLRYELFRRRYGDDLAREVYPERAPLG